MGVRERLKAQMPGGRRTDRISKRDLEVLEFVARYGVVPREVVGLWAGTARAVTAARERRWREAGLVEVWPGLGSGRLVGCKRAGLRAVGRDELAEPRLSYAAVQHSAVVARVGAELEQAGHQVLSEREILARERAEGKRIYSAERRRGRGFHRPDLVLAGERPEAVEVELTDKAARRLDDIVRSWRGAVGMKKFGCVRYLCSERAFPYVKRSVERTHAEGPIDVQLLRHGEGLRELARDWVSESARERSGLQPAG